MKDLIDAILLGIVEGLTEFIPVSSTAHLLILSEYLNFKGPAGHIFEVFIQLGAILAVMVIYRRKLWQTFINLPRDKAAQKFTLNLILGALPVLAAGFFLHNWIKDALYDPGVIAVSLIAGGLALVALEKFLKPGLLQSVDDISPKTALIIGVCQMLALIPGVSRSGATIMGARCCGLSRTAAAEFSFFLAIPVMIAAVGYDTLKGRHEIAAYPHPGLMLVGFGVAFITALIVIRFALQLIGRFGFSPFGLYRIAAGVALLYLFM
jgi:undecaprenyl-diphosphatase